MNLIKMQQLIIFSMQIQSRVPRFISQKKKKFNQWSLIL